MNWFRNGVPLKGRPALIFMETKACHKHTPLHREGLCVCVSDSVIHLCMLLCTHLIAVNTRDVAGKLLKCPFIIFYVACSRRPSSPLPSRRRSRCRSHGRSSSFTSFRRPILSRQMALTWQHQQQHPCEYPCMRPAAPCARKLVNLNSESRALFYTNAELQEINNE